MTCPDDNALAGLLEGRLPASEAKALRAHLADCADCRQLVAEGGAPVLAPGTVLDRYVVLHEVGSGAMGVVFAAWDNRLDRKVALKVLHAGTDADRQVRLEREARALARLSHPNVVTVFDVGRSAHGLFVVMEFVEGQTLRQWLATARAPALTLQIFADAGRGLAAAHAAGLVHRDFKPDNVLLGKDGRTRVSDFGLAQLSTAPAPRGAAVRSPVHALTRTGAQVGTPAYMAPEVFSGQAADARSDQFSFCTSLWEALGGTRPFSGQSSEELCARIAARRFEATAVRLPAHVEKVLRRGLAPTPDERFASMDALLAGLRPRTQRWPVAVAAAVAGLLAAGAVAWQRADPCGESVALAEAVWSGPHRAAVKAAFAAAPSLGTVEGALDRWADRWAKAHTEACEATRRGAQSEGLLDKRMQCLEGQARQTRALVALLGQADRAVVDRAVEAVGELPDAEACSAAWLEQRVPPPKDRARTAPIEEALAAARAEGQAGRFAQARDQARAVKGRAAELGYKPLEAAAGNLLGRMQERTDDFVGAEATLTEALAASQAGRDDEAAVVALAQLGRVTGVRRSKMDEGLRWLGIGRGALARLGGGSPRLEAQLEASEAAVLKEAGRLGDALTHLQRQVALLEGAPGESRPAVAEALALQGRLFTELARFGEARTALTQALALQEALLGPTHPDVAGTLNALGMACRRGGDFDASAGYLERALAISERAMGPNSLEAAYTLNHLGNIQAVRGEWAKALGTFRKVLAIGAQALGPTHHEVGMAHSNLCWTLRWLRRLDEAKAECAQARAIVEPKLSGDHGYTAEVLHQLGAVLRAQGDCAGAQQLEQQALDGATKALGAQHAQLADPLTGLGLCLLGAGKRAEAAVALKRALALRAGVTPAELGETRLGLARALPESDPRTCPLAKQAIDELKRGGAQDVEWAAAAPLLTRCR